MCGIAGVINRSKTNKSVNVGEQMRLMLQGIKHRGPDSTGYAMYDKPIKEGFILRFKISENTAEQSKAKAEDPEILKDRKKQIDKRTIVKIKDTFPNFTVYDMEKDQIPNFWSYNVKHGGNLFTLLTEWKGPKILTSRKSKKIKNEDMDKILSSKEEILVVFGTTDKGIHEMLDKKISNIQNFKAWNFFPHQGTETVRLEEAILGCLSIINGQIFNK